MKIDADCRVCVRYNGIRCISPFNCFGWSQFRQGGNVVLTASPMKDDVLESGVSRTQWHDKAWALYHDKTFDDTMLAKVNIHTIRAVFDATYDALTVPNK